MPSPPASDGGHTLGLRSFRHANPPDILLSSVNNNEVCVLLSSRLPGSRLRAGKACVGALLAHLSWGALLAHAENLPAANDRLDPITVTARRQENLAADEEVLQRAQGALRSDPYFYDEHVTVTISHGVLTLHGIVFDDWDLHNALRLARRVPGVNRVINDLDIMLGGE